MTIQEIIATRGISKVLHFTTSNGLLGMLAGKPPSLLPRAQVKGQEHLEFIMSLNAPIRKDTAWLNYSSLSIERINKYFFKYSSDIHPDTFWVILAFSPQILTHPGVYFATTNNIYYDVIREQGSQGLQRLFAPTIQNRSQTIYRKDTHLPSYPTDIQAEVLYPGPLSLEHLLKIYVKNSESKKLIDAQLMTLHQQYEVIISPENFNA